MGRVALIYLRGSMARYEQDRASPEGQVANCMRGWEDKVYFGGLIGLLVLRFVPESLGAWPWA